MGRARLPTLAELKRIPVGDRWPRLRATAQHHRRKFAQQDREPCETTALRRRSHHAKQLRIVVDLAAAAGLPTV
jgi:hypothetical protein